MSNDQIARLTESQRAYLRLVLEHRSSKQIAQDFDISAHTVDKRIKEAMRILGVGSRIEAARILASAEAIGSERQLGPQSPDLAPARDFAPDRGPASEGMGRGAFDKAYRGEAALGWHLRDGDGLAVPLPLFAPPRRRLSIWQRAGWMIGLIIGLALATGILLSGLMAVSAVLNAMSRQPVGLRQILYAALMWATLLYAMRRGGWAERSAAWIIVVGSVLSATVWANFSHVVTAIMVYDLIVFLALFAVGLFCERYWAMWVAAMGGMGLLGHLLPLMPLSNPFVYYDAISLWSWPILLIIARAVYQRTLEAGAGAA